MGISSVSWPKPFPPRPKRDWNLPKRWRGLTVSDVRTSPTPYVQDALAQPSKKILAPSYRENTLVSKQLPCQAGIEDQRGTEAQKTPCGATPNKSAGAANDLNSFRRTWHRGRSISDRLLPQGRKNSWAGQHEAAVTASRNSQGSSADVPGEIEDQRDFKAQNAPCGATPTYRQERPMISTPLEEPGTAYL